ncbi:hypothetical protein [Vibrio sp. CAU 1672]|uniref:hypothetical protein n=1 Tax=Vibrio sp. CAU 1672 TaxID=3032594 RepID=UPI0023DBC10B|nr:hypothetical protein [Vibrio sp. CAU 1672]MDF2155305.1 hypothetical protein [Vibrio sp. CAU 1672]
MSSNLCHFYNLRNPAYTVTGELIAKYEIDHSAMAYDYTGDLSAYELFEKWVEVARSQSTDGMVDICWHVTVQGQRFKPEFMPGQCGSAGEGDFLSYFSQPVNVETGQSLEWSAVPVKLPVWDEENLEGRGFIEYVTGWQPSPRQSQVSIDFLVEAAKKKIEAIN